MSLSPQNLSEFENIEKALTAQVVEQQTPSVQYVFFDKESVIYRFRRGYSDIRNKTTVNPTTSFNAYSITKTFTALAVLQLAERGLININHDITEYLPSFPYYKGATVKTNFNAHCSDPKSYTFKLDPSSPRAQVLQFKGIFS